MRTPNGHMVTCDDDPDGARVRVNGYCIISFTSGWSQIKNKVRGQELAMKIFEALQFKELRDSDAP